MTHAEKLILKTLHEELNTGHTEPRAYAYRRTSDRCGVDFQRVVDVVLTKGASHG